MDNIKEVKRKAKVGEFIRLTRERYSINTIGDVMQVTAMGENPNVVITHSHMTHH